MEDNLGAPILESTLSLHIKALYLLSVDLAGGTSGTPATSQYYPENEAVAYGFSPDDCYEMATFLDGELVLNSGSLTTDQDHALATDAAWLGYNLTVNHGAGGTTDRDGVSPIACDGSLTLTNYVSIGDYATLEHPHAYLTSLSGTVPYGDYANSNMQTIRIPLTAFTNADLANVSYIYFYFNKPGYTTGSIQMDSLEFAQ